MSGNEDKRKRRRGAFARPGDPLDLAPLPITRKKTPPKVEMPPPRVRPRLDEPVEDDPSIEPVLKGALDAAFDFDSTDGTGDVDFLSDLEENSFAQDDVYTLDEDFAPTLDEDIEDNATEETPAPLNVRATISTVRASVERIPEGLPSVSLPPASAGGHTADLANLVEVNKSEPSLDTSYGAGYQPDEDVSVYDSHSDDSLFDLVARQSMEERADDPPSDVVEFGPLPTKKEVVVHDRVAPEAFSTRTRRDDAVVFQDEQQATRKRNPQPHAWWERSTPGGGPPPSPEAKPQGRATWKTPGELNLRQRTAKRERRGRLARVGVIVAVLALVSLGAFALVKNPTRAEADPTRNANPAHPAEIELLEAVAVPAEEGPTDEAPVEGTTTEPPGEEAPALAPEEPPEEAVEEPEVEAPAEAGVIQATEELEDQARTALYETGVLVVSSTPRALIWVDGKRIGHTPISTLELEPGTHRIKAVVPGRAPKYQSVRVDPGGAHQVPFTF
jgi:hypothetical protein